MNMAPYDVPKRRRATINTTHLDIVKKTKVSTTRRRYSGVTHLKIVVLKFVGRTEL